MLGLAATLAGQSQLAKPQPIDPGNAELSLTLEGMPPDGKALGVRFITALGAVQCATSVGPPGQKITGSGTIDGRKMHLVLAPVGRPENTVALEVVVDGAKVSGSYGGTWNRASVKGAVSGAASPGKGVLEGEGAAPLELVKASHFGTAENDNFEGAVAGPDGCLYLVGNAGTLLSELPQGVAQQVTFGSGTARPLCGCGFVLKLSGDASQVLGCAQFGKGMLHATAVAVSGKSVYVGGYASDGLEPLLRACKDTKGLMTEYPLRAEQKLNAEAEAARGNAPTTKDVLINRPWLGRLGAPCVVRLSSDLKTFEGGTYLEGWQQVYEKRRICGRLKGMFPEYFWQPINVCPLKSGDVVVAHDGGYMRELTDRDRQAAAKLADAKDRAKLLDRMGFYDVADHVSRLSGDLSRRAWKMSIYTPPTVPEVADSVRKGWALPHYSNPRTHRMRMDRQENLWVCGWSASSTSQEPWWSPFLWRLDAKTGDVTRKLYEYDPMSGVGNRMGGEVADTALLSVAIEDDGNLLTSLIADGGNSVIGRGPLGNEGKRMIGPVIGPGLGGSPAHFWGQVHRVDGKTLEGMGGAKSGPWAWTIDIAGLPAKHFLALGRWNAPLPWTPDAWWRSGAAPNPNAFLRVVRPDFETVFWTAIPGIRPFELTPIGQDRYMIVGFADGATAPRKDSLLPGPAGKEDAFFAIVKWKQAAGGG